MKELADELRAEVQSAAGRLRSLSESEAGHSEQDGKWVKKEILGHLIDSAANNHQRFVRAQFADPFVWPGYEQDVWVSLHAYRSRPWSDIVDLWVGLNTHLAHVVAGIPAERLATRCQIGSNEPATLEWWIRDYLRHMRHHLEEIVDAGERAPATTQ